MLVLVHVLVLVVALVLVLVLVFGSGTSSFGRCARARCIFNASLRARAVGWYDYFVGDNEEAHDVAR